MNQPVQPRQFLVPAFFLIAAATAEEADARAEEIQTLALKKGAPMLLDEALPTVEVGDCDIHTVLDAPGILEIASRYAAQEQANVKAA